MSRRTTHLGASAIVLACAVAGTLLIQTEVASARSSPAASSDSPPANAAATVGYRIYNLSGRPLQLHHVSDDGTGHGHTIFEDDRTAPRKGDVLMPGGPPQAVELKYTLFEWDNYRRANLVYEGGIQTINEPPFVTIYMDNYKNSSCDISPSSFRCTEEGRRIEILDRPGTVHDVPADRAEEQLDTLRGLCTEDNSATCEFTPQPPRAKTYTPSHLVGAAFYNCGEETADMVNSIRDTVGSSNSFGIDFEAGVELNFFFGKGKTAITYKYKHEWTEEHTFGQALTTHIRPGRLGWVSSTAPVIRDTGTFTLELGNTTWNLHGVYFDQPDPKRDATYVGDEREMTSAELKSVCTHQPPGSNGVVRAPASAVSMHRSGTGADDFLVAGPESDTLLGLAGHDTIRGGTGDDTLYGGRGNDTLYGGAGRDALYGGPGADTIFDAGGPTLVHTGTNDGTDKDRVNVRDGNGGDTVICSSRSSTVTVDAGDRTAGRCGKVSRSGPNRGQTR
jgi:hypothetical protein